MQKISKKVDRRTEIDDKILSTYWYAWKHESHIILHHISGIGKNLKSSTEQWLC